MSKIILEEQAEQPTPGTNKIALYPKAGGGYYKKNDEGEEVRLDTFFQESRALFAYNNTARINCGAAQYLCKDKFCAWVSTITTVTTGAAGGADWWYLYLDYSAITSGAVITASELIWSITEPVWSAAHRQWMNGDDRCIFAVRTDGSSNILAFWHSGDMSYLATGIVVSNDIEPDTTWTDSTLVIPKFVRKAIVVFRGNYVDGDTYLYWRTNGSGATGHSTCNVSTQNRIPMPFWVVITDANGKIEFKYDAASSNKVAIYSNGWFFPTGM